MNILPAQLRARDQNFDGRQPPLRLEEVPGAR